MEHGVAAPEASADAASAPRRPLLVVLGPTASGKSALAVHLASRLGGEVVNADSRQVYRGLDIGTAKPSPAERQGIPHHLFDLVGPEETYSAARFRARALDVVADVQRRGKLPIVVGGTGLYLRALLEGLFEGPARDPRTHGRLERIAQAGGLPRLHRWLLRVDPEWAERVGPGDCQRILRGLDVYLQSGRPISAHIRGASPPRPGFDALRIGLAYPRAELYARIDRRVEAMLAAGLIEEVRRLQAVAGFARSNAAKAVGYREVSEHLAGRLDRASAVERIKRETRRLAKRQLTWFRREAYVRWVPAADWSGALAAAEQAVRAWFFGLLDGRDAARCER